MVCELNRPVTLSFITDWGDAGLHRMAGRISSELVRRWPPHRRTAIWNGLGGFDASFAVGRGEVQIGLQTPVSFLRMAVDGKGPFVKEPLAALRGLGAMPQNDRLIAVARKSLGITSFEDLRRERPAVRIVLSWKTATCTSALPPTPCCARTACRVRPSSAGADSSLKPTTPGW